MKQLTRTQILKKRDEILPEIGRLVDKHGHAAVESAMRKHLAIQSQKRQRETRIKQLRKELQKIERTGKPL